MVNDITGRVKNSAKFYKSGNQILLSYWDKGKKSVLVLSTMHISATNMENGLPEFILCYNWSKSGVDNMDHYDTHVYKCYGYFFNLVDVGLLNAAVIMQQLNA